MDTPFRNDIRQLAAPIVLGAYINSLDGALVAGTRAAAYASHLGFAKRRIFTGLYGYDATGLESAWKNRLAAWPSAFIFVGRYVDEKGISTLLSGFRLYRSISSNPWRLICCGRGPLRDQVVAEAHVEDRGFVKPSELPAALASAGCFILPSNYEPWGVAWAEACG